MFTGEIMYIDWTQAVLITYKKGHDVLAVDSHLRIDFKDAGINFVELAGVDADNVFNGLEKIASHRLA